MTKHNDEGFCPHCFARDVPFNVLNEFTDLCPKVKMSWDDWMTLRYVMEEEIKKGLGIPTEEESADKVTVQ